MHSSGTRGTDEWLSLGSPKGSQGSSNFPGMSSRKMLPLSGALGVSCLVASSDLSMPLRRALNSSSPCCWLGNCQTQDWARDTQVLLTVRHVGLGGAMVTSFWNGVGILSFCSLASDKHQHGEEPKTDSCSFGKYPQFRGLVPNTSGNVTRNCLFPTVRCWPGSPSPPALHGAGKPIQSLETALYGKCYSDSQVEAPECNLRATGKSPGVTLH